MVKIPLYFNFLVEVCTGFLMFFYPATFHPQLTPDLIALSRAFAIGAVVIGFLTLRLALPGEMPQLRLGLQIVLAYHTGIAIVQVMHPMPDMAPWMAPVFHGSLAGWSLISLIILRRWY